MSSSGSGAVDVEDIVGEAESAVTVLLLLLLLLELLDAPTWLALEAVTFSSGAVTGCGDFEGPVAVVSFELVEVSESDGAIQLVFRHCCGS